MKKLQQVPLLLLLIFSNFLKGQEDYVIDVQHFTTADGLLHREVRSVFQDSQGFIWIGTKYGLNRFDGHNFKNFSKERNGLESNNVVQIQEDDEGWLWVFPDLRSNSSVSFSFVNVHSWEVQNVTQRFGNSLPLDLKGATGIISSPDRTIYLSTGKQIWKYHSGQFKKIYQSDKEIVLINYSKVGRLIGYFIVAPGIFEPFEFDTEIHFSGTQIPYKSSIFSLGDDEGNTLLIEEAKVYLRKAGSSNWEQQSLSQLLKTNQFGQNFTSGIFYNKQGEYWYKDESHLYLFNLEKGVTLDLSKNHPEIADAFINNIVFDKTGNTWICTSFGIFKVRLSKNPFHNYLAQPLEKYSVTTAFSSRGIALMKNQLWANSVMDRQYLIDTESKQTEALPKPDIWSPNGQMEESLVFRAILKVNEQEFYTAGDHLIEYENGMPNKVYYRRKSEKPSAIWSIYKGKNTLWVGSQDAGLSWVQDDSLTYFNQYNEFEILSQSTVYHFLEWTNQHVLLASSTGIYLLNPQEGIVGRFWTGGKYSQHIPTDIIHHLQQDKTDKDILWVSTNGGGILKLTILEKNDGQYQIDNLEQFTIADGLPDNVTYAAYEDDFNNLWIPSDFGLIQFNKMTLEADAYTIYDGLPFNEFNRISHFQAEDGRFFFGTMNGITSFYPKDLLDINQGFNVPLRITDFRQFNGEKNQLENRTIELLNQQKITLQPEDKFLTFEFALLEYKNAQQVKYSYQIKGQSDEWIYLNDNELRLSGLPYGNFTLNIRAQGVSGQFSEDRLSIPIEVKAPFYRQIWFFVCSGLALFLGGFGLYSYRTKSLLKRQRELEKIVEKRTIQIQKDKETIETQAEELRSLDKMKSRFFANVSHELRTPLTLILAPIVAALKENKLTNRTYTNLLIAKKNGERLHKMIDEILDLTKIEADKLELKLTPIEWYPFLKTILNQFESLASARQIQLKFDYESSENLAIETDKKKMEIIFFNLLSNALKFTGEKGEVRLKSESNGKYLKVTVADTGSGIHPEDLPHIFNRFYQTQNSDREAQGGTGIGLALTNEFVRLMGGTITVESELQKGTTFTVSLPKMEVISYNGSPSNGKITTTDESEIIDVPAVTAPSGDKLHNILLVEDNPDLRAFIQSGLQRHYQVTTAENGQVAWDILTSEGSEAIAGSEKGWNGQDEKGQSAIRQSSTVDRLPSLIISDVMMPIMSGFQLLEKLKSSSEFKHIPVIMLTARIELRDKLKALRIGVDDYLTKPFVEEELYARIQNLIQNSENRKVAKSETVTEPPTPELSEIDLKWLEELESLTLSKIEDINLVVSDIAHDMNMSERQFYRQVKEHTGQTPSQYIKTLRLTTARKLLEDRTHDSVKAVAISVGFKDVRYFTIQFKKAFGRLPSEYV
jgi:signal transduction histidine kinase/DNA-binding response OmpR family regulator